MRVLAIHRGSDLLSVLPPEVRFTGAPRRVSTGDEGRAAWAAEGGFDLVLLDEEERGWRGWFVRAGAEVVMLRRKERDPTNPELPAFLRADEDTPSDPLGPDPTSEESLFTPGSLPAIAREHAGTLAGLRRAQLTNGVATLTQEISEAGTLMELARRAIGPDEKSELRELGLGGATGVARARAALFALKQLVGPHPPGPFELAPVLLASVLLSGAPRRPALAFSPLPLVAVDRGALMALVERLLTVEEVALGVEPHHIKLRAHPEGDRVALDFTTTVSDIDSFQDMARGVGVVLSPLEDDAGAQVGLRLLLSAAEREGDITRARGRVMVATAQLPVALGLWWKLKGHDRWLATTDDDACGFAMRRRFDVVVSDIRGGLQGVAGDALFPFSGLAPPDRGELTGAIRRRMKARNAGLVNRF